MNWAAYPFLRITLALISGILINNALRCVKYQCYILLLLTAIIFIFYVYFSFNSRLNVYKKWKAAFGLLAFFSLGYFSSQSSYMLNSPPLSPNAAGLINNYTVVINSRPEHTEKSIKYKVLMDGLRYENKWQKFSGGAIIYFSKDTPDSFSYGDKILIKGHPNLLKNNTNPFAFDYAGYLQLNGIHFFDHVEKDDFIFVNTSHRYSIKFISFKIGEYLEQILATYISTNDELNMAKAMVIGQREDISEEMEHVYQNTGTSHILAVSGLHVGIIYLLFSSTFKFLKRSKTKWIYYSTLLFFMWSYAFITGLSPSVIRASIMLSFIVLAKFSGRKSNIYNTILASAFFVLLVSPNLIYSVSFQLSYSAVFGIVLFYHKIYRLIYIKNNFLNFFWKITALSLSVQITTFPITIYYFKQFPIIFPLTNILAIPTATFVIIGSMALLTTSVLPLIPELVGFLLQTWISLYNKFLVFAGSFELSTIENLHIRSYQVFLSLLCLLLLFKFLDTKRLFFFRHFTLILFIYATIVLTEHYKRFDQAKITFYDVNGGFYYDVFFGKKCFTNVESSDKINNSGIQFNISPNRRYHQISTIKNIEQLEVYKNIGKNQLICLNGKSILVLRDIQALAKNHKGLKINYLIIGQETIQDVSTILENFQIEHLILDNTISSNQFEQVIGEPKKVSKVYSIAKHGAFFIDI